MPTFKITLAYDGTGLVGWQRQAAGTSVQGLIEEALASLEERHVPVTGAGRTDAGVHALGQAASFSLGRVIDPDALVRAVNARLPETVRVLDAQEVEDAFHARFDATAKTYRYRIWTGQMMSPFERSFAWHVPALLNVDLMAAAARPLEGRHDFAAFQAAGSETQSTERTVFSSRFISTALDSSSFMSPCIVYEIRGDGFLRYMVRTIVGTLIEIGRGRQPVEWMTDVLASRERARAGPTAPAHGLFLVRVDYKDSGAGHDPVVAPQK